MAFFTRGSLFHTIKRSSSAKPESVPDTLASSPSASSAATSAPCTITPIDNMAPIKRQVKHEVKNEPKLEAKLEAMPERAESITPPASPNEPSASTSSPKRQMMTDRDREIILNMTINGKTPREIAQFLGVKANAVRMFLHRRKLKAMNSMGPEVAQLLGASPSPKKRGNGAKREQ
ncbi:hypothetical protein sr11434 [Sporisorium reilianum SRZ2]|uniref:Uncharacterized protein n=1 Tax=Sporisorium reilianum (strain SRZ2) TaxID=999809 RepID=E6ZJI0_SPORE|nr:hypothetical protein sr11434 [Sporisorium reilianum SRZ2]